MIFPSNLLNKLSERKAKGEYRELKIYPSNAIDFFSNDYLGISKNASFHQKIIDSNKTKSGATGSRLISGNSELYNQTEQFLADFYLCNSSLLFASGYMANIGLLSAIAQKDDTILFDEYCHASIRDGIRLSLANSFTFMHNNYNDLEEKLKLAKGNCYVVVESLYSMDGDFFNLESLNNLCEKYNAYLIVDEAHSTGVYGNHGEGFCAAKNNSRVIARVHTFGKAMGIHGAAIVGSKELKNYLINFCRSFIYTTGLSDVSLMHIKDAHKMVQEASLKRNNLQQNIDYFRSKIASSKVSSKFLDSTSSIQALLGEKSYLKEIETILQENSISVKAIYSPSVQRNKERIRICLHSFNTKEEIDKLFDFF